jgi:hypothetical protein
MINNFSHDGKLIALRAIGNSAIFRCFFAADRAAVLREKLNAALDPANQQEAQSLQNQYELAQQASYDYAMIAASCDAIIAGKSDSTFFRVMEPDAVLDYLSTANPVDNDAVLRQLADAIGEKFEVLRKLRDDAIVARAHQGRQAADRAGGDFIELVRNGEVVEFHVAFDRFQELSGGKASDVVSRGLRRAVGNALKRAVTSSDASGFADIFLLKKDLEQCESDRDFDL